MAKRRGWSALATGTVLCAVLAGCTTADEGPDGQGPSESPSSAGTASATADPATLTLGVYGPEGSLAGYDDLAAAFENARPGTEVEVERFDDAESVVAAVAGADAPDVFLMDHDHLPGLVEEQLVQPVDELLAARDLDFGDGYQRGGLTAFASDAALQCMPHDVSPLVVYYNEDLVDLSTLVVDDEEPPTPLDGWTWEQFSLAAQRASRGPAHGLFIDPSLTSLAPFVWSVGGEIVDDVQEPTTLTLSGDAAREALVQVLALVRDPQVTPTSGQLERVDAATRFARGRLGLILGTRALTPVFRESEDLEFDVMPLPRLARSRTVADMTGYCISAGTGEVEASADLLAFAVGREGAMITTRDGYVVPSNLEVANSPVFVQGSRQPESSFVFNEGVRRAQNMPFTPSWPLLVEEVAPALDRLFYAPVIDLDSLLAEIDATSARVLAPEETE